MRLLTPLHQELSAKLSTTRADMETVETRIRSLKRLMAEQEERMERIQEKQDRVLAAHKGYGGQQGHIR